MRLCSTRPHSFDGLVAKFLTVPLSFFTSTLHLLSRKVCTAESLFVHFILSPFLYQLIGNRFPQVN